MIAVSSAPASPIVKVGVVPDITRSVGIVPAVVGVNRFAKFLALLIC
jgi:hypothetical protein